MMVSFVISIGMTVPFFVMFAGSETEAAFLSHRKLLQMDLAVLPRLDKHGIAIGEQLPVGVAHFFIVGRKIPHNNIILS